MGSGDTGENLRVFVEVDPSPKNHIVFQCRGIQIPVPGFFCGACTFGSETHTVYHLFESVPHFQICNLHVLLKESHHGFVEKESEGPHIFIMERAGVPKGPEPPHDHMGRFGPDQESILGFLWIVGVTFVFRESGHAVLKREVEKLSLLLGKQWQHDISFLVEMLRGDVHDLSVYDSFTRETNKPHSDELMTIDMDGSAFLSVKRI
jgi:hypothetical protein